jgi:hypothetical protein
VDFRIIRDPHLTQLRSDHENKSRDILLRHRYLAGPVAALAGDNHAPASIGQPDYYGRLDFGDYPQPKVIYRQPIAIKQVPANRPPVYLRVLPGQTKNWSKHCREYNACGERVFFVQDNWYKRDYVPRYREVHRDCQNDRRDVHNENHQENQNDSHGDNHNDGRDH